MLYYDRKIGNNSKTLKSHGSAQHVMASPNKHEYPYWTGTDAGNYKQHKSRRQTDDSMNSINKYSSGSNAELLQSQQTIPNYPSFKKKIMHYAQSSANAQSPSHVNVNLREPFGGNDAAAATQFNGREFNNRHSWMSGNYNQYPQHPKQIPLNVHLASGGINSYGVDEPVYEEILSNRMSDMEDDGDDLNLCRNKRLGYKSRDKCDADQYDEDEDEVDQLCLNDNDDLLHQNFRKVQNPSGFGVGAGTAPIFNDSLTQPHHSR